MLPDAFWPDVERGPGCWKWTGIRNRNGYGLIRGSRKNGSRLAHRVAWEIATGKAPASHLDVLHTCDEPGCVRADEQGVYVVRGIALPRWGHLFLGTEADNVADMIKKGRSAVTCGTSHPSSRLTDADVLAIRARYTGAYGEQSHLGREFGVSNTTIRLIVERKMWKHI